MGQMHYSVQALLSAQFGPELHAQVVALSKCPQMISQHVRTMVHTGMDAGSVFLKVVPFSTRKTSWASFVAFEKKIIPSPPPPIFQAVPWVQNVAFAPRTTGQGPPSPILRVLDAKKEIVGTHRS